MILRCPARDLSQRSFVDAMVSGCRKGGGFLHRIEPAFDWSAFEALLAPIHASNRGAPGYPPLVSPLRRVCAVGRLSRRRMGALWLLGFKSPFASMAPHPSILKSRTVAGAASRARMCKDGRWMCLLESMCRRIGWTFASGQAGRPSPSRARTKVLSVLSSACARFRPPWLRSRRRADTRRWSQARLPRRICPWR
jgi:hypothetical protein